jgi:hypothetical protein
MGSVGIAAVIAKLAFVALLAFGIARGELGYRAAALFAVTGTVIWIGLPNIPGAEQFVTSALAVVDIALVFAVFKGDVRLG